MSIDAAVSKAIEGAGDLIQMVISWVGSKLDAMTESLRSQEPSGNNLIANAAGAVKDKVSSPKKGGESLSPSFQKQNAEKQLGRNRQVDQGISPPSMGKEKEFATLTAGMNFGGLGLASQSLDNNMELGNLAPSSYMCAAPSMAMGGRNASMGRGIG